jgi:hypothetical protein
MAGSDSYRPDVSGPEVERPDDARPGADLTNDVPHWGPVYAIVLVVLALLIMLFTWLTRTYS